MTVQDAMQLAKGTAIGVHWPEALGGMLATCYTFVALKENDPASAICENPSGQRIIFPVSWLQCPK